MLQPMTPVGSATLAATQATGSVALPGAGDAAFQVAVWSPAANDAAFIKFGTSTVEALVTDIAIGPGQRVVFTIPSTVTHVAAICGSGETATLYFTTGQGV